MTRAVLHRLSLGLLVAAGIGCSTPISPYSQLDDEEDESEQEDASAPAPSSDAGRPVGARDAGAPTSSRDAGPASTNCMRVPSAGAASLLLEDCARRSPVSCSQSNRTQQQVINQHLADLAQQCGSPSGVNIGVVFDSSGCPTQLRYEDRSVFGRVSTCLQSLLENERIGCKLTCALIGPAAR